MLAQAEQESANLSRKLKDAHKRILSQGGTLQRRVPFGYQIVRDAAGVRKLTKFDAEQSVLKSIRQEFKKNNDLNKVCDNIRAKHLALSQYQNHELINLALNDTTSMQQINRDLTIALDDIAGPITEPTSQELDKQRQFVMELEQLQKQKQSQPNTSRSQYPNIAELVNNGSATTSTTTTTTKMITPVAITPVPIRVSHPRLASGRDTPRTFFNWQIKQKGRQATRQDEDIQMHEPLLSKK